ncbi:uncharacterized protein TNCV_783141 [Trichonephila clavipes]|nr:uncharacterized protein TNCV_783141 [Trichonephila clavipes]
MLEKVIENWTSRLDYIRVSRGSHMPEIIFKMRVARQLGRFDCVVRRCWDQRIRDMSFIRRQGLERLRQSSRRVDRHIVRNARVQPTASSTTNQAHVAPSLGGLLCLLEPYEGAHTQHKILNHLKNWTATAGSDVVQSGRSIFDDFFQHLWPYIGNNTANVVFQMVKRLWLIRIDQ